MRKLIVLIITILSSVSSYGQYNASSNIKALVQDGKYDEAYTLLIHTISDDPSHLSLLGEVAMRIGKLHESEEHLHKALQILEQKSGADQHLYASVLNQLALVYWNQGQDQEAEKYMLRSIDVRSEITKSDAEVMAGSFNDLGLITARNNPENALINYEKALDIYKKAYGETSEKVAQGLINTGIIFRGMGQHKKALNNFSEAGKIIQNLHPKSHSTLAFIESNTGRTYENMGMLPAAMVSYTNALSQYHTLYGERHPEIANVLNLIGSLKLKEGDHEGALENFQEALIANSREFNDTQLETFPSSGDYYHPYTLLTTLFNKSKAYKSLHFNKTLKLKHLKQGLRALEISDSLISKIRYNVNNENDKLIFGTIASDIYEEAVRLSFLIADKSIVKKPYFEKAFYFNERSKASVLQEAINNSRAKKFAGLPEELLQHEEELITRINLISQKLLEKPSYNLDKELRAELLTLERKHQEFILKLEKEYPDYYLLKYPPLDLTINAIKNKLDPSTALLSYFIAEKNKRLYIFIVTKNNFKVVERIIDEDFSRYIKGLRNGLYFQDKETFLLTSYSLGKLMIPRLPSGIKHLVVIPSGALNLVPFETLLVKKAKGQEYNTLPYLIKDYTLSYAYATSLFLQRQRSVSSDLNNKNSLLFAPVNFEYDGVRLPSLPATAEECKKISEKLTSHGLKHELFVGEDAGEGILKLANENGYRMLHLATHGYIDESRPGLSRIYLNAGKDDGRLYTGEIYNLKLESDLITLSACETALGKISEGEGVLGFTRALLFAGAQNVIVSLWKVQDASTAEFMANFYDEMVGKPVFGKSLRKAKLEMISSKEYSDPFFWAPFVLIGE